MPQVPDVQYVIGLMSGSSLDGLDIAYCSFDRHGGWHFLKGAMVTYNDTLKASLSQIRSLDLYQYKLVERDFSQFCATAIKDFIRAHDLHVDYISSHGHTVLHHPEDGITLQMGSGATISAMTGLAVICDYRQGDVSLSGQGAPLASLVDRFLFDQYDTHLNLGGIANISIQLKDKTIAYDICPCNQILNRLAEYLGKTMDENGFLASTGVVNQALLARFNALEYFTQIHPKSLDNYWVMHDFWSIVEQAEISIVDKLATMTECIAMQIQRALTAYKHNQKRSILVTGGGTHNSFLITTIQTHLESIKYEVKIPSKDIIDYKEAILMAYMAYLRMNDRNNILATATGASRDSQGGAIYKV